MVHLLRAGAVGSALLAALWGGAPRAADVPRGKEVLQIDLVPGKMGAVRFTHADHAKKYKRPDGTPIRCRDCHHTLATDEPASPSADMRCGGCHVRLGEAQKTYAGKEARRVAALRPDGAIEHNAILFHDYCRGCHRKEKGGERMLGGCKVCHERGVGSDVLHGRYDAQKQPDADLSWIRCPAGQIWSGLRCEGKADAVPQGKAAASCPEGYRAARRAELLALLDGCAPAARPVQCRPCAQSKRCSELLGADDGLYWAGDGAKGEAVRLADGLPVTLGGEATARVRCVK